MKKITEVLTSMALLQCIASAFALIVLIGNAKVSQQSLSNIASNVQYRNR